MIDDGMASLKLHDCSLLHTPCCAICPPHRDEAVCGSGVKYGSRSVFVPSLVVRANVGAFTLSLPRSHGASL